MNENAPPPDLKPLKWIVGGALVAFAIVLATLLYGVLSKPKVEVPWPSADELAFIQKNPEILTSGHAVYLMRCAVCHGKKGEGQSAPNLTDDYWLHGDGSNLEILKVIRLGVLPQGMPGWEGALPDQELNAVAVYVRSLRGSNPLNAKSPQGDKR